MANLEGITREFVTITGASKILGVNRQTVYRWIRQGYLPARRFKAGKGQAYYLWIEDIRKMGKQELASK